MRFNYWRSALFLLFGATLLCGAWAFHRSSQAQGDDTYRLFAPMVACDSCVLSAPTSTPTATGTASPTGTASASATTTQTATATATATHTATLTPTATPTTGAGCTATTASITALDKVGESVTISGSGMMTGWYVISESGGQRFNFPDGYVLNGSVVLDSGSGAVNNPPGVLLWTTANIWNNSTDDDAFLYDCTDALRSTFDDGI